MSIEVTSLLENLMAEPALLSWHEETRHNLGIPEECADEALLCMSLHDVTGLSRPVAFVLTEHDLRNTLTAIAEYVREAFHPLYGHGATLAVFDMLPPLDELGMARGVARRWVLDPSNYTLVMAAMQTYLKKMAKGL